MRDKTSIVISLNQLDIAVPPFYDPTGGEINNALEEAAALLEIDNKSAEKVLKDAAVKAQAALDRFYAEKDSH